MQKMISWIHFGDLHLTTPEQQNYRDFLALIEEANKHLRAGIDFALLPGDNADHGSREEYQLVQQAISRCRFPVHAIAGDHDAIPHNLELFQEYLSREPYQTMLWRKTRFLFLNSVALWTPPVFGLGEEQMFWLRHELAAAESQRERVVVFMHAYPSEHGADAPELRRLFCEYPVLLVEMGHTHYNELACDGHTIYATTRSTGQIEEGPAGFSVTTLDQDVVSWKFKPIGEWPLVMVTSPADERLIHDPSSPAQVVRGEIELRARVWGDAIEAVTLSIDGGDATPMEALGESTWGTRWNTALYKDGSHSLTVSSRSADGCTGSDRIRVRVSHNGDYVSPPRREIDYENAFGEWPEKHILGTQLGPNENGHAW